MEYTLKEIRERLAKENAKWAAFFAPPQGMGRLRNRIKEARNLLEEFGGMRQVVVGPEGWRGSNRILISEDGYQILRQMLKFNIDDGMPIARAIKAVRAELRKTTTMDLSNEARQWIEHKISAAIIKEERARKDAITDIEKRLERLEQLHRRWLPWHRLPRGDSK